MDGISESPHVQRRLPQRYIDRLAQLEMLYMLKDDPLMRSGFAGGPERWRREREPILDAVTEDGAILDIGCANGMLLQSLVDWARERGVQLTPHGVDAGQHLVAEARHRLPGFAENLHVGNVWNWQPPRRYRYVYMVWDCVPVYFLGATIKRLLREFVAPGGRLILGTYGSRSREQKPFDLEPFLKSMNVPFAGRAAGGEPRITNFFWIDA
ncbi:MAG: class I SAM-dependent methyltransferase [Planctomycetes bacterium]|nr:class I SAM-dependent methyltransferase [Planctomycetota bacterium]